MILSLNAGSTSLKYKLFDQNLKSLQVGSFSSQVNQKNFQKLVEKIKPATGQLKIVHRLVHGGTKFQDPIQVDKKVLKEVKKLNNLAPLHNPFNLKAYNLAAKYFSKAKHYFVFDTGFFKGLPLKSKIYPIPLEYYYKKQVQKFGFHGISHQWSLLKAKEKLGIKRPNLIILHLGGGCSACAILKGKPLDTSMGYTPLAGLPMWTRPGNLDPGLILALKSKYKIQNLAKFLNQQCGLKALSGACNYLDLIKKYQQNSKKAKLAIDIFIYQIQKFLGAYYAVLKGKVDAVVFTGKIGAGDVFTKNKAMHGLKFLNKVKILKVKPDEEKMMALLVKDAL